MLNYSDIKQAQKHLMSCISSPSGILLCILRYRHR
jgi:hypothetical protein